MTEGQPKRIEDLGAALQAPTMQLAEAAKSGDMNAMNEANTARMIEILNFAKDREGLNKLISTVGGKPLEPQAQMSTNEANS